MRNDTSGDKELSIVVEVQAPRIRAPFAKYFEKVFGWVIAPNAAVELLPLLVHGSRFANNGLARHPVTAIKPSIRAPHKGAQSVVRVLVAESIQQNLRRSGRLIFSRLDWNKR